MSKLWFPDPPTESEPIPPELSYCPGASLATVKRGTVKKICAGCGEEFTVAWFKKDRVTLCFTCSGKTIPRRIGADITRFSRKSRKRLMRILNTVRFKALPLFVTLTYPDECYRYRLDGKKIKNDLRRFEWRFRRKFPKGCYLWRLDVVDRKSGEHVGEYFPHYHLMVFNVGRDVMRQFVINSWPDIVAPGDEDCIKVHSHPKVVTWVRTRRGIMSYASKAVGAVMSRELAKDVQSHGGDGVGRWWGISVRMIFALFLDVAKTVGVTEGQAIQLMRYFRKLANIKARQWQSLTVFIDGVWLEANLSKIMSPP